MSVVEDKVTELVNAIQDTNEYKRYQEAKNKLHALSLIHISEPTRRS